MDSIEQITNRDGKIIGDYSDFRVNGRLTTDESESVHCIDGLIDALEVASASIRDCARYRAEARYWENLYQTQLSGSIKHNEAMMGNVLGVLLKSVS